MDSLDKAFALARIGVKVFPCNPITRAPMMSGDGGVYLATSDDSEQIATWFTEFPNAVVGVWTGGSDLVTLDIDKGKKNGKDGFASMAARGYEVSPTEHYTTSSGGEHHIYASDRDDLAPDADAMVDGARLEGVDIRAAGSYFIWWGDTVPESRAAFSTDIPSWVVEAATSRASDFTGEGFSGSVDAWLEAIPDDILPSGKTRYFMEGIPSGDFGHNEMVDLAWGIVRMGSERETGIKMALGSLRDAWLRGKYDTPKNRRDFDMALKGAIKKAGRVQTPVPAMIGLSDAMKKAREFEVDVQLKSLESKVSETGSEVDFARARRAMFKIAAEGGLSPAAALGIVTGSKSFKNSKVSIESVWFGDGEPLYHDLADAMAEIEAAEAEAEKEVVDSLVEAAKKLTALATDSASFTFLTPNEQQQADTYDWWGKDYLDYVKGRLKHFNKPYHVSAMWAALSVIASSWGKVPLPGAKLTDCNLYIGAFGESTSGKTESWEFGMGMIDAYFGTENGPIIGDISKLSALALHRALIMRDGEPSLVYGDEIQSFFQGVQGSQWQNGVLGDISSHYGGNVSPKLTLNDKDISGKRAKTMLTTYLTGIADQTLDAISINHWTNGFFYRFLWSFGAPRQAEDDEFELETGTAAVYTEQFDAWAKEFKKQRELQRMKWGEGRKVDWDEDARLRMGAFKKQVRESVITSSLYDSVFVSANRRFMTSIAKCATLVALAEGSETVKLAHVLVAISFAGPWHRSMVLAVSETGKDIFEREVEKALIWIQRNAIRQVGKPAVIQRSMVMREFRPNEVADRLLRQLTEEGWLVRAADTYQLSEG